MVVGRYAEYVNSAHDFRSLVVTFRPDRRLDSAVLNSESQIYYFLAHVKRVFLTSHGCLRFKLSGRFKRVPPIATVKVVPITTPELGRSSITRSASRLIRPIVFMKRESCWRNADKSINAGIVGRPSINSSPQPDRASRWQRHCVNQRVLGTVAASRQEGGLIHQNTGLSRASLGAKPAIQAEIPQYLEGKNRLEHRFPGNELCRF